MINWKQVAKDNNMGYYEFAEELLRATTAHMDLKCNRNESNIMDFKTDLGVLTFEKTINSSG